ncbi:hypothetical protein D6817_00070 [Candidatus Pacearchaeota archaeon]|nr:MAG: hypothetical protein D6817_00070 [Candidatus Pacearchaeota archaeon]
MKKIAWKKVKRARLVFLFVSAMAILVVIFSAHLNNERIQDEQSATSGLETEKLAMSYLPEIEFAQQYRSLVSKQKTGSCGALSYISDDKNLTGSCCGKMRLERYVKQRAYLARYANIQEIPKDPWNVPAKQAHELVDYGLRAKLTAEENEIYKQAFEIFEEGPCCCKCWRWFAFDGLAEKMIKEKRMGAEEIAKLWAAQHVCGDEDPFEELKDLG